MNSKLKAFGFSLNICLGLILVFFGFYLIVGPLADPLETIEFIWEEMITGLILLFIGLFCIIFPINYSFDIGKVKHE